MTPNQLETHRREAERIFDAQWQSVRCMLAGEFHCSLDGSWFALGLSEEKSVLTCNPFDFSFIAAGLGVVRKREIFRAAMDVRGPIVLAINWPIQIYQNGGVDSYRVTERSFVVTLADAKRLQRLERRTVVRVAG